MRSNIDISNTLEKLNCFDRKTFKDFEGYRIGRFFAVSYDEVKHNYQSENNFMKLWAKTIIRCFIVDYSYDFSKISDYKIQLFYSHEHARRADYVKFMQDVSRLVDNSELLTGYDTTRKFVFNKTVLKNLLRLYGWFRRIREVEDDMFICVLLLSKLSMAYRWKRILDNNTTYLSRIRGLVSIFDAREYENIITQFVKKIGICSATLQHGHFPGISKTCMGIPFTGFVSDEFWAWGEYGCENAILSGLPKENCRAVGYPKSFVVYDKMGIDMKRMGIILDGGETYFPFNKEIVSIAVEVAKEHNLKIILKPHPNDKYDYVPLLNGYNNYELSNEPIFEYGRKVCFSLCYASSAYIDLLAMRSPVFRYRKVNSDNCYSRLDNEDAFFDVEELEVLLKRYNNDEHINDKNREALLGDLSRVKSNYNETANNLFL